MMNKSSTRPKSKPPPYPRPVSPVVAEELPPGDEDVAWYVNNGQDGFSEQFNDTRGEQRAAKRRRIEACAQAYLRGDQLYIMSSQLRGPFDSTWKNPWAKKAPRSGREGVADSKSLEIPETERKTFTVTSEGKTEKDIHRNIQARSSSRRAQSPEFKDVVPQHPPSPFVGVTSNLIKSPIQPGTKIPTQAKETRVKEWLRTNQAFAGNKSEIQVQSSPTPAARYRSTPKQKLHENGTPRTSQSEPIAERGYSIRQHDRAASEKAAATDKLSDAVRQVQQLSRDMQSVMVERTFRHISNLQEATGKPTTSASKNAQNSSRAEFAILKAKRSLAQTESMTAHLSTLEPGQESIPDKRHDEENVARDVPRSEHFKFPPQPAKNSEMLKMPTNSPRTYRDREPQIESRVVDSFAHMNDDRRRLAESDSRRATDQDRRTDGKDVNGTIATSDANDKEEPRAGLDPSRPNLSTAASNLSTTTILPSAQPILEPQLSISSATRDEKLQSIEQLSGIPNEANDNDNAESGPDLDVSHEAQRSLNLSFPVDHDDGRIPVRQDEAPNQPHQSINTDMQGWLENSEPIEMSTVKKLKSPATKEVPISGKGRLDNKRKKTSFIVDQSSLSSHGSIKDAMKAKISKNLSGPSIIQFGKDDLDIEVSDDESESARKRSKPSSSNGRPKSILKSTNPVWFPSAVRDDKKDIYFANNLAEGRSGNIPVASGQNAVNGDHFDLDAAIDDLGSFLGPWDAEKEASSLGIEL